MTDLGHGKLLKVTKNFDSSSILAYDSAPTLLLDNQLATVKYVEERGSLAQVQAYYVAQAGNDSNDGKSIDTPFLTIAAANSAIAARTPSISNVFVVYFVDGIFVEDFVMQPFTVYAGKGAVLEGEVVAVDNSAMMLKRWYGKSSGGGNLITKVAGGGNTVFTVEEDIELLSSNGVRLTSGSLNIQADGLLYSTTDFIGTATTAGAITCHFDNRIGSGNGQLINVNTSALRIDIFTTGLIDSGTTGSTVKVYGSTTANLKISRFEAASRKAADVDAGSSLTMNLGHFREGATSTVATNGTLNISMLEEYSTRDIITKAVDPATIWAVESGGAQAFKATQTYAGMPNNVFFEAILGSANTNVTGDGTDHTINNWTLRAPQRGSSFNIVSGVFTAPITGIYEASYGVVIDDLVVGNLGGSMWLQITDTATFFKVFFRGSPGAVMDSTATMGQSGASRIYVNAGATFELHVLVSNGAKVVDVTTDTYFSMHLVSI
jgi:hypothetical protein